MEQLVNSVISHPAFKRRLEEVMDSSSSSSPITSSSNNNNMNSSSPSSSARLQFQSPSQEIQSIFVRGGQSGRYARSRRSSSSSTATSSRRNATSFHHQQRLEFRTKEVVLLPSPTETNIVKGSRKTSMMANGFVRSELNLVRNWTEDDVSKYFEEVFKDKLEDIPCSSTGKKVEILLGVGNKLQAPCLAANQPLDGERMARLFSQKIIWLRPFSMLVEPQQRQITEHYDVAECMPDEVQEIPIDEDGNHLNSPFRRKRSREEELESLLNDVLENNNKAPKFKNLKDALDYLSSKVSNEKERLKVETTTVLEDAFCYFKSVDFNPNAQLLITYKNQSAVDAGGVRRQFYTDLFYQLSKGCGEISQLFEGNERRKLPVHNSGIVLSGIMELVGKILAHALVQSGSGIGYLSPAVYHYILHGDITEVMSSVCIGDTINSFIIDYAKRVFDSDVTKELLDIIFNEDDFQQLWAESGLSQVLTMKNRDLIIQAIIFHDVIGKRIPALEQLRKGLKFMGVLDVIQENPVLFEGLFVYKEDAVNSLSVLHKLKFIAENVERNGKTHEFLLRFIDEASVENLEKFLVLCHGSKQLPLSSIDVIYSHAVDGFAVSTCLLSVTVPSFQTYREFSIALNTMMSSVSFSTV